MTKIKILFIDIRADLGGGSQQLRMLLEKIDKTRFEIFVAAPAHQVHSPFYQKVAKDFIPIPFRSFSLNAFDELTQKVLDHGIHLVHSFGKGAGVYSRLLGEKTKITVVHAFHGVSYEKTRLCDWPKILVEKWLANDTARFLHVSQSEQKHAAQLGISRLERSVVISNGIDIEFFKQQQTKRGDVRAMLNIKPNTFVVGCVARFDACKRHCDLINAFEKIVQTHPQAHLMLVGEGETKSSCQELADQLNLNPHISFLGARADAHDLYSAFDLFVLVSEAEGLPLTPLEAMASKCPVVLTDVRGNADIVEHEKNGMLVPLKNLEAIADAVKQLIADKTKRTALAANGEKSVAENYGVEKTVMALEKLYQALIPFPEYGRVALAHDWLFHMRGGEKVLESIAELFPSAPIYTLFVDQSKLSRLMMRHQIKASPLQYIPFAKKFYRFLLPLMPFVVSKINLSSYDLVISSHHCVIKGVRTHPHARHVCYCHTPMRYAWGFESQYTSSYPPLVRFLMSAALRGMRRWDLKSNDSVDYFIANSKNVSDRIAHFYGRNAAVVYPPIDDSKKENKLDPMLNVKDDFFLVVSALVPYKRIDLAIEAFRHLPEDKLMIIGDGPLLGRLKQQADSNVSFLGWQNDEQVRFYYQHCKALIFPTEEDFGMVPVEAMMYGKPVIAYGRGGVRETVSEPLSGIFFHEQTAAALVGAIKKFSSSSFDAAKIIEHARQFSRSYFEKKFLCFLQEKISYRDMHAQT
ncbi:MAG: hypothetical protein COW12_01850 [Candidatus Omnitrophica bacterium CG12_big_fil_rev_8_21_14_0_65_45_16]|nr:MAG: hypothetical protein COW12_01850 [Candidatus Omnitrophica bacterium CG12_big_fil_rev_8_21_14_0_65_45_16]